MLCALPRCLNPGRDSAKERHTREASNPQKMVFLSTYPTDFAIRRDWRLCVIGASAAVEHVSSFERPANVNEYSYEYDRNENLNPRGFQFFIATFSLLSTDLMNERRHGFTPVLAEGQGFDSR